MPDAGQWLEAQSTGASVVWQSFYLSTELFWYGWTKNIAKNMQKP